MKVKAITLLAYDTAFMIESIKTYVDIVDEIYVGLDENRQTWAGGTYELEPGIVDRLKALSPKIRILEDQFYIPGLSTMENDTRERNFLSSHIEDFDYILSVDSDEFLLNPEDLRDFLAAEKREEVCILGSWVTVYKELESGYLVIANSEGPDLGDVPILTDRTDRFVNARWTKQNYVMSPAVLLHFSWARSEEELRKKLDNWSHKEDLGTERHLELWLNANERNYKNYKNFHPVTPEAWPQLMFIQKSKLREEANNLAKRKVAQQARG
jgi:hypothetical protein